MTITLPRKVSYYFRCAFNPKNHRFERSKPDALQWCPLCGGVINLYGLKDSTAYADQELDGVQGS